MKSRRFSSFEPKCFRFVHGNLFDKSFENFCLVSLQLKVLASHPCGKTKRKVLRQCRDCRLENSPRIIARRRASCAWPWLMCRASRFMRLTIHDPVNWRYLFAGLIIGKVYGHLSNAHTHRHKRRGLILARDGGSRPKSRQRRQIFFNSIFSSPKGFYK